MSYGLTGKSMIDCTVLVTGKKPWKKIIIILIFMIKNMYYYLTINYFNHEVIQPFMSLTILNITRFHMKDYFLFFLIG